MTDGSTQLYRNFSIINKTPPKRFPCHPTAFATSGGRDSVGLTHGGRDDRDQGRKNGFNRSVVIRVGLVPPGARWGGCYASCFNRSVAIRVGLTADGVINSIGDGLFQSLGRDSGRSDLTRAVDLEKMFQSLGRDSRRSDSGPPARNDRSMFQSLGRDSGRSDDWQDAGAWISSQRFNRSVAIRVGLTPEHRRQIGIALRRFQSLGRDSRRSDRLRCRHSAAEAYVSIARSRFGSV